MTDVEATKLLKDLAAVATQLNEESDDLNEVLDAWDEKLRSLNIGLERWVAISSEDQSVTVEDGSDTKDVPGSVEQQLGWAKYDIGGGWRLVTREATYRGDADSGWQKIEQSLSQPIGEASREVRIEALEVLPRLLQELKESAEKAVAKIARAKKLVK